MSDANEQQPWNRMDGETDKAYRAFDVYLRLGPDRSIAAAFKAAGHRGTNRHWEAWSSKYDWPARASAYDDHLIAKTRAVHEDLSSEIVSAAKRGTLSAIHKCTQLIESSTSLHGVSMALSSLTQTIQRLEPQDTAAPVGRVVVSFQDDDDV